MITLNDLASSPLFAEYIPEENPAAPLRDDVIENTPLWQWFVDGLRNGAFVKPEQRNQAVG